MRGSMVGLLMLLGLATAPPEPDEEETRRRRGPPPDPPEPGPDPFNDMMAWEEENHPTLVPPVAVRYEDGSVVSPTPSAPAQAKPSPSRSRVPKPEAGWPDGASTRADDPRLHLKKKLRPPPGTDRVKYVGLLNQGLTKDEALWLLTFSARPWVERRTIAELAAKDPPEGDPVDVAMLKAIEPKLP